MLGLIEEEQEKDLGSPFPRERRVVTFGLGASDWRAIMLVPNPQGGTDYTVVSICVLQINTEDPSIQGVANT